jgi:hypothetical protein
MPALLAHARVRAMPPHVREYLSTSTGEPFQPIRLYYDVPSMSYARQRLKRLRCLLNAGAEMAWLYEREAQGLRFEPRRMPPPPGPPTVIGRFRFSAPTVLTLQLRSLPRARTAVQFFAPVLGAQVTLSRVRIVNRLFEQGEASKGLHELDSELDQNVTVCEAPMMNGATNELQMTQVFDVPLIEDCPVPWDDSRDFVFLGHALNLRMLRALEHFDGGSRTLGQIELEDVQPRVRPV